LRTRPGADAPRPEDRLVRRVLVVVDEDPLPPLLLPPGGGQQVGPAALELARDRDGGGTHLVGVPPRLEPEVDVDATLAGRLREAGQTDLLEQVAQLTGGLARRVEVGAGLGIEIEAQL